MSEVIKVRLFIAALLCFGLLQACARNIVPALPEATPKVIFQMGNAYGILQAGAITYASLEVCPPGTTFHVALPCRTKEATAALATADAAFMATYVPLKDWLSDPTTLDGLTLAETLAAARSALDHYRVVMDIYNVGALQ